MNDQRDWIPAQGDDAPLFHALLDALPAQDGPVGVAVSGGGDSVALLHLSARLAERLGHAVRAVTVDHGLRPGSADEARQVAALCAKLHIPHDTLRWPGPDATGNLQAQARRARYDLMADWARANGVSAVLLGHTADDQAETFVMRLCRRAGVDGLSLMEPCFRHGGVTFLRPLGQARRCDLRAYLSRHGIAWTDDPSNEDSRFERVRARRALRVLEHLGLGADQLLSVSSHMTQARDALRHATADAARALVTQDRGDLIFAQDPLRAQPSEIRRRLLQGALGWIGGARYPQRATALVALDIALAEGRRTTLGGCLFSPAPDGTFRVSREAAALRGVWAKPDAVWDGRWRIDGPAPHDPTHRIRALGEGGLSCCPDWRDRGMPRASLLASPALWDGDTLIAAPLATQNTQFRARLCRDDFPQWLVSH